MCPSKRVYDQAASKDAVFLSKVRGQPMEDATNEVMPQARAIFQKESEELQIALAGDKEPKQALDDAQSFIDTVLGQ